MKTLIIIPAYNEQDSIEKVVRSVIDAGYDYVVVNDGSRDATLDICRSNGFNILNLPENLGIGGAVQTGHKFARDNGYDIDIQFDGDGQHDVASIPVLIECIDNGADIAIGSRFISTENTFRTSTMRRAGIRWLKWMIRISAGITVTDATSGFRACGKNAIRLFASSYPADYPEPESIAYAAKRGLEVREAPVVMHERQGGSSSIGALSSIYYMIKVSLAVLLSGGAGGAR